MAMNLSGTDTGHVNQCGRSHKAWPTMNHGPNRVSDVSSSLAECVLNQHAAIEFNGVSFTGKR